MVEYNKIHMYVGLAGMGLPNPVRVYCLGMLILDLTYPCVAQRYYGLRC